MSAMRVRPSSGIESMECRMPAIAAASTPELIVSGVVSSRNKSGFFEKGTEETVQSPKGAGHQRQN